MFCDWLNVWQQFEPGKFPDFLGGRVVSFEGACGLRSDRLPDIETGELENVWMMSGADSIDFEVSKFKQHFGSYETSLMIRMVNGRLDVRGNASSWGRLDNLFGVGLDDSIAVYNEILRAIGLPEFTEGEETNVWSQQDQTFMKGYTGAHVTRIDATQNYAVGMGKVREHHKWLAQQKLYRSAPDDQALERYAQWNYDTVYVSDSKFWINCKWYDKAKAIQERTLPEYLKKLKNASKDGRLAKSDVQRLYKEAEDYLDKLALWCAEEGVTRGEWSLRNRYFAQRPGLGYWKPGETESKILEIVDEERDKIMRRAVVYQEDSFDRLTDREFRVLSQWKKGEDVRNDGMLSKSAFYRFRSSILEKTGHDIAARPLLCTTDSRPVFFQVRALSLKDAPVWYQRPVMPFHLAA